MVRRRISKIGKVVVVLSGKGGVGKSVLSASLALLMRKAGYRVGLLDADIYGPSAALLLGTRKRPREGKGGLVPPTVAGVKVMSVDLIALGVPLPLMGHEASEVILEMLALTDWGVLDFLVVDMPPSTADILMAVTSLGTDRVVALVVTTPDGLASSVTHRTLELVRSENIPVLGLLENNQSRPTEHRLGRGARNLADEFGIAMLGSIPYDGEILRFVDSKSPGLLSKTAFARAVGSALLGRLPSLHPQ
jgi:ATP-binding protein involved in chromosome partitioning